MAKVFSVPVPPKPREGIDEQESMMSASGQVGSPELVWKPREKGQSDMVL